MFFSNVLKTLLAVSLAVSGVSATENDLQEDDASSSSAINYGRCYELSNAENGVLGHWNRKESFLAFGSKKDNAILKVCQNLGECTIPKSKKQGLKDHARFWLYDTKITSPNYGPAYIAANDGAYGTDRQIYPVRGNLKYYVNFWGENNCDSKQLGKCPVKLHTDNMRDRLGLQINEHKRFALSDRKDDTVKVTFKEVPCPT